MYKPERIQAALNAVDPKLTLADWPDAAQQYLCERQKDPEYLRSSIDGYGLTPLLEHLRSRQVQKENQRSESKQILAAHS